VWPDSVIGAGPGRASDELSDSLGRTLCQNRSEKSGQIQIQAAVRETSAPATPIPARASFSPFRTRSQPVASP